MINLHYSLLYLVYHQYSSDNKYFFCFYMNKLYGTIARQVITSEMRHHYIILPYNVIEILDRDSIR